MDASGLFLAHSQSTDRTTVQKTATVAAPGVNHGLPLEIQKACDDLHHNPEDATAFVRLRRLLSAEAGDESRTVAGVVSRRSWRRLVKIACDELFDEPGSREARDRLLLLLAAGSAQTP